MGKKQDLALTVAARLGANGVKVDGLFYQQTYNSALLGRLNSKQKCIKEDLVKLAPAQLKSAFPEKFMSIESAKSRLHAWIAQLDGVELGGIVKP